MGWTHATRVPKSTSEYPSHIFARRLQVQSQPELGGGKALSPAHPSGEALRRAMRFISAQLQEDPERPVLALVDRATLRFDLNPKQAEYLVGFYKKLRDEQGDAAG
jgi:hypothetical protein